MLRIAPVQAQTNDYAAPSANSEEEAAAAYREAFSLYESGDLRGALLKMKEAHRVSGRAELLYNIARLEKEVGDCAAALSDYQRYLELVPQGTYRAEAEAASKRLRKQCPEPEPPAAAPVAAVDPSAHVAAPATPEPTVPPPVVASPSAQPAQSYWTTPRIVGWSAIAAGTLAGAGAIYFRQSAIDARDRYAEEVREAEEEERPTDDSLMHEQHRDERWAWAFGVTGSLLAAGGIVMLALAPSSHSKSGAAAWFHVQPGLVAAAYSQRF
jgi:tetratricopeptide (TPR) repeat protein